MSRSLPFAVETLDLSSGHVDLTHGAGGRAMMALIHHVFRQALGHPALDAGHDGAVLPAVPGRLVIATDAHVVAPLFFPGGDIGSLAVHGTLNDVAAMGAQPLYLSASFILEEGLALADLQRIAASMGRAARESGVPVVTGDTKVVPRGQGGGVYITTTGVGVRREAALIGEVVADGRHFVQMQTRFGGRRLVHWLAGDPLPRIC